MKMSIVIPCYNEEKNIPLILERFRESITGENIEVVIVNNGSTDKTNEILKKILFKYPFAKSVFVPINKGYGHGILQGLNISKGDFIGWTHADMQTDPYDVIKAYKLLEKNNWNKKIFVKGNRKKRAFGEKIFSAGMSIFESLYFGKLLREINAQPNIFSNDFYKAWKNPPEDFSLDLYALYMAKKAKLKIKRIDVVFPKRIHGKSSWNTGFISKIKQTKKTLDFSKKLKKENK